MACVIMPRAVCVSPWFAPASASGGWRCAYTMSMARGGRSKCCRIQVMLNGSAALVIEETQADHYLAIYRATGRKLMRRLARHDARPAADPTGLAMPAAR